MICWNGLTDCNHSVVGCWLWGWLVGRNKAYMKTIFCSVLLCFKTALKNKVYLLCDFSPLKVLLRVFSKITKVERIEWTHQASFSNYQHVVNLICTPIHFSPPAPLGFLGTNPRHQTISSSQVRKTESSVAETHCNIRFQKSSPFSSLCSNSWKWKVQNNFIFSHLS